MKKRETVTIEILNLEKFSTFSDKNICPNPIYSSLEVILMLAPFEYPSLYPTIWTTWMYPFLRVRGGLSAQWLVFFFFFQEASDRWSLGFFFTSLSQWEHEKRKPISFLLIIGMTSKIVKLEFLGSRLMDPCAYFKTRVRLGDDTVIMVYAEVIWRSSKDFGVAQPPYSLYNAPL